MCQLPLFLKKLIKIVNFTTPKNQRNRKNSKSGTKVARTSRVQELTFLSHQNGNASPPFRDFYLVLNGVIMFLMFSWLQLTVWNSRFFLAKETGFEPISTVLETIVLPIKLFLHLNIMRSACVQP